MTGLGNSPKTPDPYRKKKCWGYLLGSHRGPRAEGVPPSLLPLLVVLVVLVDSWLVAHLSSFELVRWLAGFGLVLGWLGVGGAADDSEVVGVVGAAFEEGPDVVHY